MKTFLNKSLRFNIRRKACKRILSQLEKHSTQIHVCKKVSISYISCISTCIINMNKIESYKTYIY